MKDIKELLMNDPSVEVEVVDAGDVTAKLDTIKDKAFAQWLDQPPNKYLFKLLPVDQHELVKGAMEHTFEAAFKLASLKTIETIAKASEAAARKHFEERALKNACVVSAANGGAQA